MVVLGLLLLIGAAVVGADVFVQNTHHLHGTIFSQSSPTMTLGSVFIAGAVLGCIAMFALWMMLGGFTLARRRRLARRQQVRDAVAEREALAAENARLEREVARARTTRANADTAAARAYPTEPAPAVEASPAEEEAAVGGRRGLWRR